MTCWVLAIRGTYRKHISDHVKNIIGTLLGYNRYHDCFDTFPIFRGIWYIYICDKPNKCHESEKLVKELEERPAIVLLTPKQFFDEVILEPSYAFESCNEQCKTICNPLSHGNAGIQCYKECLKNKCFKTWEDCEYWCFTESLIFEQYRECLEIMCNKNGNWE